MPAADLPVDGLAAWLVAHGLAAAGSEVAIAPLPGGTQNVLLDIRCADRNYVLRAGPPGGGANSGMVEREVTLLGGLDRTRVPHPRLVAAELDAGVLGRPFYLMQRIDGVSAVAGRSGAGCIPGDTAVADALLELARVVPDDVGLGQFSRSTGWIERQVPRWTRQLDSYRSAPGYGGPGLPRVDAVADWLTRHVPPGSITGLVHGDLHLGNLLFSRDGSTIAAIVDWELAALGDPLLDLAELLVTWPDRSGASVLGAVASAGQGLPTAEAIFGHYREGIDRDVTDLRWFLVLACFRLGILLEGSRARVHTGDVRRATADALHSAAIRLVLLGDALCCEATGSADSDRAVAALTEIGRTLEPITTDRAGGVTCLT